MDANTISAKIIKAEMLGDLDRVADLKKQLDQLNKDQSSIQCVINRRNNNYRSSNNESRQKSRNPNRGNADELNKLNAKIIKAEMMGDAERVKELKSQLEDLKSDQLSYKTSKESNNNPIDSESSNLLNESQIDDEMHSRLSVCTSDPQRNARLKQLARKITDDRMSLNQMFVSAKKGEVEDEAKLFLKASSKLINMDDEYEEVIRKGTKKRREEREERPKNFNESDDQECGFCIQRMRKHLVVSIESTVYLCLPQHEPFLDGHCYIRSRSHIRCSVEAEENCLTEIMMLRKRICQMFASQKKGVVFTEMHSKKGRNKHFQIECFPIKQRHMTDCKMYFKKAIMECEKEWSMNKKLVEMKDRCISKSLPKGLSYFWVSFGPANDSYGHVIEDELDFSKNFAYEVISGLLDIDRFKYTKPKNESFDEQFVRVSVFKSGWKQHNPATEVGVTAGD